MKSINTTHSQSGAVSIFVVVFAALLLSIITIGFVRLMVADQQRATNNDLSQSAYDSALTGVEDVKRSLLRYQSYCQSSGPALCAAKRDQLTQDVCNVAVADVVSAGDQPNAGGEVLIQQQTGSGTNDTDLNQAYTCVKMRLDTPDYVGNIASNASALIPLIASKEPAVDGAPANDGTFNEVTIQWFNSDDLAGGTDVTLPTSLGDRPLVSKGNWVPTRPPVMRVGLMQYGTSFKLEDFDSLKANGQSNAHTMFLYPSKVINSETVMATQDKREELPNTLPADGAATPYATLCSETVTGDAGNYSCEMKLRIPDAVNSDALGNRTAYLRLTALYNLTHFRITLSKDNSPRLFSDVQASVDSTGRANDLFRRVQSRIDMIDTTFPYPDAALDIGGDLCKNFSVTDVEYFPGTTCAP